MTLLAKLENFGIVESEAETPVEFRYWPRSDELRGIINELGVAYSIRLVSYGLILVEIWEKNKPERLRIKKYSERFSEIKFESAS